MEESTPIDEIVFNEKYENFHEYYKASKTRIYQALFDSYVIFSNTNIDRILRIISNIDNMDISTDFKINKENTTLYFEPMRKVFEDAEDYERCEKVLNIRKIINNI